MSMPIIGTIPMMLARPSGSHPPLLLKLKIVSCAFPFFAVAHNGAATTKTPTA